VPQNELWIDAVFVTLTGLDGSDHFVNLELITRMVHNASAATPFTTIYFDHHNFVEVTETPQKIITAGED
jgi:hypothetical protein